MAKDAKELFSDITFIFKIVELGLAIAGMAIMIDRGSGGCARDAGESVLFNLAFSAYVIIMFILILTIIFDELGRFVVVGFLILGALLNMAAAIVGMINYSNIPKGHGGGSCLMLSIFAIVLCVIMIVDCVFEFKK